MIEVQKHSSLVETCRKAGAHETRKTMANVEWHSRGKLAGRIRESVAGPPGWRQIDIVCGG